MNVLQERGRVAANDRPHDTGRSVPMLIHPTPEQRFWSKVDKSGDCWTWQGSFSRSYGQFSLRHRKSVRAHRFAYELESGPIPAGLQIDHLCRNRACVNPAHLEAVTARVNTLRSDAITARLARRTQCGKGQPYDEANTRHEGGNRRRCRTCDRLRMRERYYRNIEASRKKAREYQRIRRAR